MPGCLGHLPSSIFYSSDTTGATFTSHIPTYSRSTRDPDAIHRLIVDAFSKVVFLHVGSDVVLLVKYIIVWLGTWTSPAACIQSHRLVLT